MNKKLREGLEIFGEIVINPIKYGPGTLAQALHQFMSQRMEVPRTNLYAGVDKWAELMGMSRAHVIFLLRRAGSPKKPLGTEYWDWSGVALRLLVRCKEVPSLTGACFDEADLSGANLREMNQQPFSLPLAFLKPVEGIDLGLASVEALSRHTESFDECYGACADRRYILNVFARNGSLEGLVDFALSEK